MVPVVVMVPPVKVKPFTVPDVATDVTVPEPNPVAAISIPPAVLVTVIFYI